LSIVKDKLVVKKISLVTTVILVLVAKAPAKFVHSYIVIVI